MGWVLFLPHRVKHKQELAALKQELTKLQQESKSGQKSKDVTAKELEATKKKLQDVEAKLKVAVSDKQAALQVQVMCTPFLHKHAALKPTSWQGLPGRTVTEQQLQSSMLCCASYRSLSVNNSK